MDNKTELLKAAYQRLVRDAYNEGFSEGMREHTSSKGGNPWGDSNAFKKMSELARNGDQ
jgi:hypothetical protein